MTVTRLDSQRAQARIVVKSEKAPASTRALSNSSGSVVSDSEAAYAL